MSVALSSPVYHRWLNHWAWLTVSATIILLSLGAIVTTFHVGMADPIWPTYPWHLLLASWEEPRPGFLIEHTHRLAGYVVGCCVIALVAGLLIVERRRWVKWLGVAALAAIITQGLLGGFRVLLDQWVGSDLAMVHACFGPVVLALLTSVAVVTSRPWISLAGNPEANVSTVSLRRWTLVAVALTYVQIVFGSLLRHTYSSMGPRGHLLLAFAVVATVTALAAKIWVAPAGERPLAIPVAILGGLVVIQICLGVEAWMFKYLTSGLVVQAVIRTAHVLTGSLVLAAAVAVTLLAHRQGGWTAQSVPLRHSRLEGAA